MRVLCVAEKPSIAKAITQILSGGQFSTSNTGTPYIKNYEFDYPQLRAQFIVTSVTGHLFTHDFGPQYKNWNSCDPFVLFDAPVHHQVSEGKDAIARNLTNKARACQELVIWTDCDREGENIGAEVKIVCRQSNPRISVKRARFSAIIANQIHQAAQNPVALDMLQAAAVDARSLLDLRLGAAFTRMQTLALQRQVIELADQKLISYGPCQFPTLGFVVSRYEQVQAFVPETFWFIYLSLAHNPRNEREQTEFTWKRGRLFEFETAMALYELVLDNPQGVVTKVTKKNVKKWKPLPLTTVELQKAGSRLLRMTPKKILDIAEKLYQSGFLSYPRTETDCFDKEFDHQALITKQAVDGNWGAFAASLQQGGFSNPRRGKNDDHAHPPIHPTAHAGNIAGDDKCVYEFITRRYLACCSKDAEGFETTVDITAGGEAFSATGLIVLARNYLDVYPYDKWGDKAIPDFVEGQEFMPSICELRDGQTSQPSLLTEADLVGLMDKNGIGTDATIAQHIQTIIDREYVVSRKEGTVTYLVPSTLGIGLIHGYNKIGFERSLSKPQLRRETERMMVQVCEGTMTKAQMLDESIELYKHVFVLARNQFETIVTSVRRYVTGERGVNEGHGGSDDDGGSDGDAPAGGGARGRGRGRGRGAERGRGRGRGRGGGGAQGRQAPPSDDSDDEDFWGPPRPPGAGARPDAAPRPALPLSRPAPPAGRRPGPPPDDAIPKCQCDQSSVERTVTRESENKGRKFWTCEEKKCTFFQWQDGPMGPPTVSKTIPAKRKSSDRNEISQDSAHRCKCDLTAVLRTVMKEGPNQGRDFWTCPNSEKARCGYFEWDDGNGNSNSAAGPSSSRTNESSNRNAGGGNACYKCGEEGHFANACPGGGTSQGRSQQTAVQGTAGSDRSCFKCGEEGHFSNVCPNGGGGGDSGGSFNRTKSNTGSTGKTGECFKCGKTGHWSSDCPNPGGDSSKGRRSSSGSFKAKRGRGRGRGRGSGASRGSKRRKGNYDATDDEY